MLEDWTFRQDPRAAWREWGQRLGPAVRFVPEAGSEPELSLRRIEAMH
jgi:hypothetical protein